MVENFFSFGLTNCSPSITVIYMTTDMVSSFEQLTEVTLKSLSMRANFERIDAGYAEVVNSNAALEDILMALQIRNRSLKDWYETELAFAAAFEASMEFVDRLRRT